MDLLCHLADLCVNDLVELGPVVFEVGRNRLACREIHIESLLEVLPGGNLDDTVQVYCHHGLGTGSHRGRTHRVLVGGVVVVSIRGIQVCEGVAQTAAA